MRRRTFIFVLMFSALVIVFGCAEYRLPHPYVSMSGVPPLDADKNRTIDDKDVQELEARVEACYQKRVLPYYAKAGIKVETEKAMWSEKNVNILKNKLSVAEWEQLIDGMKECNKLKAQLEATKGAVNGKPPITDSGTILDIAWHPERLVPRLDDGRYILLTGVGVPNYASRYRKMANDMFDRLTKKKTVKIEYDVVRTVGDSYLQGYLYTDECFINAEIIAKGYAKAMPSPPNSKYDSEFKKLEKEAKEAKRGIWAFTDDF